MSYPRYRRLASITSAALLAMMLFGTGAAQASPPGWVPGPISKLPPTVGPGSNAGYSFSVANGGSSNIATLFVVATNVPDPAVYATWKITTTISGALVRQGTCPTTGALKCSLGALNSGQTASFLIAYAVGTSDFSVTFQANTTGSIQSPNGHNHGDVLEWKATTSVSSSKDFAGGFQLNGGDVFNPDNLTVGKNNIQGSSVHQDGTLLPVTIQDGFTSIPPGTSSNPCSSYTCIGDWTVVQVGSGSEGPIEVKLIIYGKSIKGSIDLSTISLWHDNDPSSPITQRCNTTTTLNVVPGGPECVTVSFTGNNNGNVLIDAWLNHNGTLRGLS